MTRRQERRRRLARWLAIVGSGAIVGALIGGWAGLAVLGIALAIAHRGMIAPPGVPILTYHSVSRDPAWLPWGDEIAVHPATLERHLATLAAMRCRVIATRDLLAATTIPRDAVILHFDDGYRDNHIHAAPLLRRFAAPATFYVSLDFVRPDDDAHADEAGYMDWREIAALDADPLFDVEPHGIDHGRVPTSDRAVDRLTAANWKRHAWLQWAATPGLKHDWFRHAEPQVVPLGAPVPESQLAFAAPAYRDGAIEPQPVFEARIMRDLARCRDEWRTRLGRDPNTFCWPENRVGAHGRRIAAALGYRATTGGSARNAAGDPPAILSRLHAGDRALGFRWLAAEGLWLRANVRLWQGNHYWYPLVAIMAFLHRIGGKLRK